MILLFLDTYYIDGALEPLSIYNLLKDILVPTVAILLTLIITQNDRKTNARNREEDLAKYEGEKLEVLMNNEKQKKHYSSRMLKDLETFLAMTISNARAHLSILETMIERASFDQLSRFPITIMVNMHLQGLLRIDYNAIKEDWDGAEYLQYLNSIELIDKLYNEITLWNNDHKLEHSRYFRAFDNALHTLFYEIDKLRFDDKFNKTVFNNLEIFKDSYNNYVENFKVNESPISAKKVSELKRIFLSEEFMKLTDKYYYLHTVILDIEIAIISLERLAQDSGETLITIKSGIETHIVILENFRRKLFVPKV